MSPEFLPVAKISRQQVNLFGEPIDVGPAPPQTIPLAFKDSTVRMVVIKGAPWWVAADVCRLLELSGAPAQHLRRLDDDEKGVISIHTPGGMQEMLAVDESGLYELVFASRKAEARHFKRWIKREVLPSIRKTGTYTGAFDDRIGQKAKQIRCDRETAKVRCEVIDANKANHARLASGGAVPHHFKLYNNAAYRGQFGVEAPELRRALGVRKGRTPLDRMSEIVLSQHKHAKLLADRIAREAGVTPSIEDQCLYVEAIAREIVEADLARFGSGFTFGVREDEGRGRVLDVVRAQLPMMTC